MEEHDDGTGVVIRSANFQAWSLILTSAAGEQKIDTGVALDLWSNCGQRCAVTILRGRLERRTLEFRPVNVHVYFLTRDLGVSFYILPQSFVSETLLVTKTLPREARDN